MRRPIPASGRSASCRCREESAIVRDYGQRYQTTHESVVLSIEQRVLGSDFGSTGFTTLSQARQLAKLLPLSADKRLLDIGTGCGWPGLYLALESGCTLVATDLPLEGLRRAVAAMRRC